MKAQSISINTIIVAAIGLAVLVVLFAIFTGRFERFTDTVETTDSCEQKCTSLGMAIGTILDVEGSQCASDEQKIAGKYKDSKFGCCCRPN